MVWREVHVFAQVRMRIGPSFSLPQLHFYVYMVAEQCIPNITEI